MFIFYALFYLSDSLINKHVKFIAAEDGPIIAVLRGCGGFLGLLHT